MIFNLMILRGWPFLLCNLWSRRVRSYTICRPSIPKVVTDDFVRRVPSAEFTSNPCRIQYCTREIVVFREDIVMKMCRNCVRYPTDGDISKHVSLIGVLTHSCSMRWAALYFPVHTWIGHYCSIVVRSVHC